MASWLGAAVAYLVGAFLVSALMVRFIPHHPLSRRVRCWLPIFPLVPPVIALLLLAIPIRAVLGIPRLCVRLFEALSGRRQFIRIRVGPYGYEYSSRRRR